MFNGHLKTAYNNCTLLFEKTQKPLTIAARNHVLGFPAVSGINSKPVLENVSKESLSRRLSVLTNDIILGYQESLFAVVKRRKV